MGLDQYLYDDSPPEPTEIGYWRKANQIHAWFVEHVQGGSDDQGYHPVTRSQLQTLRDLCHNVMRVIEVEPGTVIHGHVLMTESKVGLAGALDGRGPAWRPLEHDGLVITSHELIAEMLPTKAGFFFGSTDYDEYYLREIDDTLTILDAALSSNAESFAYQADW